METKVSALRILNLTHNIIGVELGGEQCPFYHKFIKLQGYEKLSADHGSILIFFFYRYIEWCPCNTVLMPIRIFRF